MSMDPVIKYWNSNGLATPVSSTSKDNPDWAYWANCIEKRRLTRILDKYRNVRNMGNCLDIGAGLGRFLPVWQSFFSSSVMLEPAESLWQRLCQFDNGTSVRALPLTFEEFSSDSSYDLLFASGILYFLDDIAVDAFLAKCTTHSRKGGLLVIRDFVSRDNKIAVDSSYVKGSQCYYRTGDDWKRMAGCLGWSMKECSLSKPTYPTLRRILNHLHIQKILRAPFIPTLMDIIGNRHLHAGINTVFMVFSNGKL